MRLVVFVVITERHINIQNGVMTIAQNLHAKTYNMNDAT